MSAASRIDDIIAKDDILTAVHAYMRGQDRLDPRIQRSAFHDDAYVNYGGFEAGPDDYVAFAQGALSEQFEASHHMLGQVSIEVDGKRAQGEVYFIAWHRMRNRPEPEDMIIGGRYIDEYADRGQGWKIAARRELIDWARIVPAADNFISSQIDLHFGRRDGRDFSQTRDWPTTTWAAAVAAPLTE